MKETDPLLPLSIPYARRPLNPSEQLHAVIMESFGSNNPVYALPTQFNLHDSRQRKAIGKYIILVVISAIAGYLFGTMSNKLFEYLDSETEIPFYLSWLLSSSTSSWETWFFISTLQNNTLQNIYFSENLLLTFYPMLQGMLNLTKIKKLEQKQISALTVITQYAATNRITAWTLVAKVLLFGITLFSAAFNILNAFDIKNPAWGLNDILTLISCVVYAAQTWFALIVVGDFPPFQYLLFGNDQNAHARHIARALKSILQEQKTLCEAQGYEAFDRVASIVHLCAESPLHINIDRINEVRQNVTSGKNELQKMSLQLLAERFENGHSVAVNEIIKAQDRLFWLTLFTMGNTDQQQANATPDWKKLGKLYLSGLWYLGFIYYFSVVMVLSGLGYSTYSSKALEDFANDHNWDHNLTQFLYWINFTISLLVTVGLGWPAASNTYPNIINLTLDSVVYVFQTLIMGMNLCLSPCKVQLPIPAYQPRTQMPLDYHLSKSVTRGSPMWWCTATLLTIIGASCTWGANLNVNLRSLDQFLEKIGITDTDLINYTITHLNLAAIVGVIALNSFYASKVTNKTMVSSMFSKLSNADTDHKRKVRATSAALDTFIADGVDRMTAPYLQTLFDEDLIPHDTLEKLPKKSMTFFEMPVHVVPIPESEHGAQASLFPE